MNNKYWLRMAAAFIAALGISCCCAAAQTVSQQVEPESVQQAQTIHIPINVTDRKTLLPVKDLTASDFSLDIDSKPRAFELSRPWDRTVNAKTGQAEDRPNLLIILPLGAPIDRQQVLDQAIQNLTKERESGWNISILDDMGNQTPYTRDLKTVIAELKEIENATSTDVNLTDWRTTAVVAVSSMRDLPGRRVVMALGDIFHQAVIDQSQIVYQNFEIEDIAIAARNAGAVIYAADSSPEVGLLRRLSSYYSLVGEGPWLLLTRDGHVAGWISDSVSATIDEIRRDGMGAYDIDVHLDLKQMDGQIHVISITPHRPGIILNAPLYYVAPNLAQLRQMATAFPALREVLRNPPPDGFSPLQLATQLAYFPHPDGKTGTQIATTEFFWTKTPPPSTQLEAALQLEQTNSGYVLSTTLGRLRWPSPQSVWNIPLDLGPGAYTLRVAAADASGKIAAATNTSFTVEPATGDDVLISSLVLGKSCVFAPQSPAVAGQTTVDYLRAGNCDLQPDASHSYSPQDIVWTLVRITPTGKLVNRPSKDWKGSFVLIDANGSKLAEEPVHWLSAEDGSLVATTAFPLGNPKLKLMNGDYAVVFRLKGPGIEPDYGEDASFRVYGEIQPASSRH